MLDELNEKNFDEILTFIDLLFPLIPYTAPFKIDDILIRKFDWPASEKSKAINLKLYIHEFLQDFNYAFSVFGDEDLYCMKLTDKGREAKLLGGHFKFIAEKQRLVELQEKQIKSVLDTNKSVRKTNLIVKTTSCLTVFIVFVSTLIAFLQYYKNEEVVIKLNREQYNEVKKLSQSLLDTQKNLIKTFIQRDTLLRHKP